MKKGTINFETYSNERVNGEVASAPSGNHPGSLSYNATGEFFFLPFTANDISSHSQLYKGEIYFWNIVYDTNLVTTSLQASSANPV